MKNELYQLVAIDKFGKEYIIELKNDNKQNKGALNIIDYGTCSFQNSQHLADYLFKNGKIPTKEVYFSIKYFRQGPRYLPVIYNNASFKNVIKNIECNKYYDFVNYILKKYEILLCNPTFYRYINEMNQKNYLQNSNGNYLNNKLINCTIEYYNAFIKTKNIDGNRFEFQSAILKELYQYKQLRTLYIFMEEYKRIFKNDMNDKNGIDDTNDKIKKL